jgi:signal transduction histidine kinase/ActR/RegA family two-component response regulator
VTSHALVFNGHPARCSVIEDVTQKEQLERRLQQSERLESLGQLAGGVAHDFNNLLGIIAGYTTFAAEFAAEEVAAAAQNAAQDGQRWQQMHDDLAQVLRAVDRASRLTRQLLAFARRDVVRPDVLDLNAVVGDVEQLLLRTLGEDIQLHTHLAGDLRPVKADPGQLEQVLVNLAVNARDAMPTGGTLVIDTGNVVVDEHYVSTHPGIRPGDYVRLRVSDTGTGMSRATVERAFEPFFTTKPKGQGTGLGLATIYGIITEAGGQVQIYSEPGVGTTITALLPATADAVVAGGTTAVAPAQAGRGETILVVEDEESLRALTQRILVRNGYRVLTAADGPAALARAADHPGPIDLLLTDVVMPRMLGHDLAREVLETRPEVRVIYMSGYAETVLTVHKTLPPGVTLLSKPVSESALLSTVRQMLDSPVAAQT